MSRIRTGVWGSPSLETPISHRIFRGGPSSQSPRYQGALSRGRVIFDPINGLPAQLRRLRDLRNPYRLLADHALDDIVLRPRVGGLPTEVGAVLAASHMLDTSPLSRLGCFGLCLGGRRHEANQRISNSLLHRIFGGAIEREVVDDGPDHNAAPHELPDGVANILIVSAEAI